MREFSYLKKDITFAIGLSVLPLPFVLRTIGPHLHTITPTYVAPPLAMIDHSIFELDKITFLDGIAESILLACLFQIIEVLLLILG